MAALTLTIPDAQLPRLVAAIASYRGVDVSAMTNAQKAAMLKQDVVTYWIERVQAAELPAVQTSAMQTATATRVADINANLTVT